MSKSIFTICGVIDAVFAAFHLYLGWTIEHLPSVTPGLRAFMHALNLGGFIYLVFLAVAFLACQADLRSRLGRATILLGALVYLTRALEEFVLFPRVGWMVFGLCAIAGFLHVSAWRQARAA
jgi:hypothetical protein